MATQEKPQPVTQPAEDMFGRPTSPRHPEPEARPREAGPSEDTASPPRKAADEKEDPSHGGIDDIPDGDGPRSDRGTNPLPDVYWTSYPGD